MKSYLLTPLSVSLTDPTLNARLLKALSDPQTQIVGMGRRSLWERYIGKMVASLAVGVAIGMAGNLVKPTEYTMQQIQQMPQQVHWIEMPPSAFLEVARRPNGSYSLEQAMAAYHAAGLDPQQATEVASRLQEFSPVIMGVADKDLEKRFIQQAKDAIEDLSEAYPKQEAALAKMVETKRFPASTRNFRDRLKNPTWVAPGAAWLQAGATPTDVVEPGSMKDMSMEEARGALENIVAGTGLRALRTVPTQWSSPEALFSLARSLEEANNDLSDATGWEGQVLGLGGRLILKMGPPPARTNASGLAQANINGEIDIQADWDNLAHEWLHGVEYFSAQIAYKNPSVNPLTHQSRGEIKDLATVQAFQKAYANLKVLAPNWQSAREEKVETLTREMAANNQTATILSSQGGSNANEANYWVSSTEGLAYSFQAYVGNNNPIVLSTKHAISAPYRLPASEELQSQSKVWPQLFASLSHLNLTKPYQPAAPTAQVEATGFVDRLLNRQAQVATVSARSPKSP